ncbi:MAG: hypothetical protein SNJ74_12270 [Fimbriimonadaceae bacterium]
MDSRVFGMAGRMLLGVFLIGALALAEAAPRRLSDYRALVAALTQGRSVRVVVDYAKTAVAAEGRESPGPPAVGGMKFDPWEKFGRGLLGNDREYVAASHTVLIGHPRHGHVLNYVRVRVYEDGTVEILARYLSPTTYEVVMEQVYRGAISRGADDRAVSIFALE